MSHFCRLCAVTGLVLSLAACKPETPAPTQGAPASPKPASKAAAPQAEVKVDRALLGVFAGGLTQKEFPNPENPITEEKITLGRMLYYETRLSKNGKISCNTCHLLDQYGVDGAPVSTGHDDQKGGRSAPTVYNAAGHFAQFWDGRAKDVEEQAKGPILNPIEMAMGSETEVLAVLKGIPGYVEAFKKAFPGEADPVTYDNLGKAIGAFERRLVTPAPFDAYLAGDENALTSAQKQGLQAFLTAGCMACHNGPLLGGNAFQKLGVVKPWPDQSDPGRFEVTKNEADRMFFKVPSLRNITKTGPYFHNGAVADLKEAVKMMASHQLGRELDDATAASIVTFLESLTGDLPMDYIAKPALP